MSLARITIMNYKDEKDLERSEDLYFPNAELVTNVQTGPKSIMSLAIYTSYEEAEKNLEGRQRFQEAIEGAIVDSFYYEGDLTYFYKNPMAKIGSKYSEKDRIYFASRTFD